MEGREFNMKNQLPGQMTLDDVMIIGSDFREDVDTTLAFMTAAIKERGHSRLGYQMTFAQLVHVRDLMDRLNNENKQMKSDLEKLKEAPEWHTFTTRPMTDEEKEYYDAMDVEDAQMLENCPDDGEEVILLTPWGMTIDTFHWDADGCYFDERDEVEPGWKWMATPKPPKEETE